MKDVIKFLQALKENNNREWFQAHKAEYVAAQSRFNEFTDRLIAGISAFDETVSGLSAKDCTYRIYRDTRFSNDKSPYKLHIGAFVCRGGKKSGFAGYYFQVGPEEEGYSAGNMMAVGHYCFETPVLRLLREDISMGEGDFEQTLRMAPDFRLDDSDKLRRVPNGFDKNGPYADYLRYRSYCLVKSPGLAFSLSPDCLERTLALFETTRPFLDYLNRAIEFSRENND